MWLHENESLLTTSLVRGFYSRIQIICAPRIGGKQHVMFEPFFFGGGRCKLRIFFLCPCLLSVLIASTSSFPPFFVTLVVIVL